MEGHKYGNKRKEDYYLKKKNNKEGLKKNHMAKNIVHTKSDNFWAQGGLFLINIK